MELTDTQLKQLEHDAALLFTLTELAAVLGVMDYELANAISDTNSKPAQAYLRGRLETIRKIRLELINNAADGSPAAQTVVVELSERQERSFLHA